MQNHLYESHTVRPDVGELMKGDFMFPLAQQRALSPYIPVATGHLRSRKTPLGYFHILRNCEVSRGNYEVNPNSKGLLNFQSSPQADILEHP